MFFINNMRYKTYRLPLSYGTPSAFGPTFFLLVKTKTIKQTTYLNSLRSR